MTLRAIDTHWMSHIDDMAHLREQVAFAGFAQRDPLIEYQDQGFRRFEQLLAAIDGTIVRAILQVDFGQFMTNMFTERTEEDAEHAETNEGEIEAALNAAKPQTPRAPRHRGAPADGLLFFHKSPQLNLFISAQRQK